MNELIGVNGYACDFENIIYIRGFRISHMIQLKQCLRGGFMLDYIKVGLSD